MRAVVLSEVRYDTSALLEYESQAAYYRERGAGMERRFHDAIQTAVYLARSRPDAFALLDATTGSRCIVVRHFPFRLIYIVRDHALLVVAIAHTSRHVDHYLGRL